MILYDLDKRFNVQPVRERQFFSEWQTGLPEPTTSEKHRLDRAKTPVKLPAKDETLTVQGKIDVLVIQDQLWILVLESKQAGFLCNLEFRKP